MKKCTDMYGNMMEGLTDGAIVESDLAIFTVGHINMDTKMVFMDKDKPYKIKKPEHPMASCVRSGHYGAIAPTLVFSSLD